MEYLYTPLFLNTKEPFITLNVNILETNLINILILLGLLFYVNQVTFKPILEKRKNEIIQVIENAQEDVLLATNYYLIAQKNLAEIVFLLYSWKAFYQNEKISFTHDKHKSIKFRLATTFLETESLIISFEKKAFVSLQHYLLFTITAKIVRKFFILSEKEQTAFLETTISKLKRLKNEL